MIAFVISNVSQVIAFDTQETTLALLDSVFQWMQNYELGLAIILLAETEADAYRPQIQTLVDVAVRRQREDGAWNYYNAEEGNGDVSISQYMILALWTAKQYGFEMKTRTSI